MANRRRRVWIMRGMFVVALLASAAGGILAPRHFAIGSGIGACSSIDSKQRRQDCVAHRAADIARTDGIAAVSKELATLETDTAIQSVCHIAMHDVGMPIGKRAAKRDSKIPEVNGTSTCINGLAHGLMIGYLNDATWNDIERFSITTCPHLSGSAGKQTDYESCVHAVGHAMYRQRPKLKAGITTCSRLATDVAATGTERAQSSLFETRAYANCVGGMLMERTFADMTTARSCPNYGTTREEHRLQSACAAYLPINMVQAGMSLKDAARECLRQSHDPTTRSLCAGNVAGAATSIRACTPLGPARGECELAYRLGHGSIPTR